MRWAKILIVGVVALLILTTLAGIHGNSAMHGARIYTGEKHLYLVEGYSGNDVLRSYGKMKMVSAYPEEVRHAAYVVNVDYMKYIHIGGARFDPLSSYPHLPTQFTVPDSSYYLVQFSGPVSQSDIRALSQVGKIIWYVPYNTYVVRLSGGASALSGIPHIRWYGVYQPYFKLGPDISRAIFGGIGADSTSANAARPDTNIPVRVVLWSSALRVLRQIKNPSIMKMGNIEYITGYASLNDISAISEMDNVLYVEKYVMPRLADEKSDEIVGGVYGGYGTLVNSHLLYGDGIIVAVADTGIDTGSGGIVHPDLKGQVIAFWSANGDDAHDGFGHGTHVSGIIAGTGATGERDSDGYLYGLGMAPHVHLVEEKIFSDSGAWLSPNYSFLAAFAQSNGAIISSNSWGAPVGGEYTADAAMYDMLTRDANPFLNGSQQLLFVFAAGNSGPNAQSVGSPGTAKNVLTVGAVGNDRFGNSYEDVASFSSRGPTADGRLKPDVVAPGTWISSALSQDARPGWAWGNIDKWYEWCGGTSQATPHVSGAAALFAQYYEGLYGKVPSPALIKAALINTAIDLNGSDATAPIPNNNEGWGMVYLPNLIDPPYGEAFMDENATLQTGQTYTFNVSVVDTSHPLKITMDYTDAAASPDANPTLVNDLNLVVYAPDGTKYVGNNFANGWTVAGNATPDALNNTENVYIQHPIAGNYTVMVVAQNVPMDAVPSTPAIDQDFAIVITGGIGSAPHYSAVRFSKNYYRPSDNLNVFALDSYANVNHGAQDLVKCELHSQATGDVENLVLMETELDSGVFNASIPMAVGAANPGDGVLQVSTTDVITATYRDYLGSMRYASTVVDGVAPVVKSVYVSDIKANSAVVNINTSEPTSLVIHYGTSGYVANVSHDGVTTHHSVLLKNLVPYTDYYFDILVTDRAGNSRYYDNGGAYYSFKTALPPPLLLVENDGDNYQYSTGFIAQELDDLGYPYAVWNVATQGMPTYTDMQEYSMVIWNNGPTWGALPDSTLNTFKEYMNNSGRLVLIGQNLLDSYTTIPDFYQTYLHVSAVNKYALFGTTTTVYGVSGNPITGNYTAGLQLNSTYYMYIDELINDGSTGVSNVFMDTNNQSIGVMVDNATYRAVFMTFPYECLAVSDYPAAKNITWNMLHWLLPGKDVFSVKLMGAPWDATGSTYTLNVLVSNMDNITHSTTAHVYVTNATGAVNYLENKTLTIAGVSGEWLNFSWTPGEEGLYYLHVFVDNATNETVLINNNVSIPVYVRTLLGTLKVAVIDSWISDYSGYGDLDQVASEWYKYGNYELDFDLNSLNKEDISVSDILNAHPDVLMISNAWTSAYGWEFTQSEISAIKVAVIMGHGIVATSGTFDGTHAPGNMALAPIFGLNESVPGYWADTVHNYTILNASSPVFNGLTSPIPIGYPYSCVGLEPAGARVLASTDAGQSTGKVGNITEYKFGGGEALYAPTMVEVMYASSQEQHLLYNMLLYAYKNSSPIQYDMAALNITTDKPWVQPGSVVNVTVNVMNAGTAGNTATVKLYAEYPNGTTDYVGTSSLYLAGGSYGNVVIPFSPVAEGNVMLKAVVSSANDMISADNVTYGNVYSRIPRGTVLVVGVDSLGTAYPAMMVWKELQEHWYMYGNHTLVFDMGSLNGKNITYQDIVNSRAEVLYISDAWNNYPSSGIWWEFSDSEIAAIKQYVSEGHGLIMSSGTLSTDYVPNNMKLASLAGLDPNASAKWANSFSRVFNVNMTYNESKYIFAGISTPYTCGLAYTAYDWALNASDPADEIANSTDNLAGIFFHKYGQGSVIYFSHLPEYAKNANEEDRQLVYNSIVFTYTNSTSHVVDNTPPTVQFANPTPGEVVSGTMSVGVNATDNISWVPTVQVFLVNATVNISFDTIHDFNAGLFKVSIDTTKYSDGNYTLVAEAIDYYGNVNWSKVSISIDNSAPVVSIISPRPGAVIVGGNVTVNWTYKDVHMKYVKIEIDGRDWITLGMVQNYTFHNLSLGTHTVVVMAVDSVGNAGSQGVTFRVVAAPVPSAPAGLAAKVGMDYVNLTWNVPNSTGGLSITEYRIYRGTASGAEVYIGNVSGAQHYFNDTAVESGVTYYYYVTAVNANGESEASNEVSASPLVVPELSMLAIPVAMLVLAMYVLRRRR